MLLQNCKKLLHLFSKYIDVFAIFQDSSFNVRLANNIIKSLATGSRYVYFKGSTLVFAEAITLSQTNLLRDL